MTKYGIQSSILTMLYMGRLYLVTKEKVKKATEGKLKNEEDWKDYEESINDDLERFFINLQNQKEVKYEGVESLFTPKLTNEELELIEEGNKEHLKTYWYYLDGKNPDVDDEEMKKSDSKSKYVHGRCWRRTIPLRLETKHKLRYIISLSLSSCITILRISATKIFVFCDISKSILSRYINNIIFKYHEISSRNIILQYAFRR